MKIKKGFVLRQVCGENVVVGEGLDAINFGKLLSLNETAAWLWQQAVEMGDFTIDSLVAQLTEEYDVTEDVARRDVSNIVNEWLKVEVVE
jgi:hypothetical protein